MVLKVWACQATRLGKGCVVAHRLDSLGFRTTLGTGVLAAAAHAAARG